MSVTSNKQLRKSKLVPRTDADEYSQSSPKRTRPEKIIEVPSSIKDGNLEVEEFNIDDNFDDLENNVRNNTFDSFPVESEDDNNTEDCNKTTVNESELSTSMVEDIQKINLKYLLNSIYQLSKRSAKPVKQCTINEDTVFKELESLLSTDLSPADKILAVQVRNSWGRIASVTHTLSEIDSKIQTVLNKWKDWSQGSKLRGTPLLYKCYICSTAWWHLHEFREHLVTTHDTPDLSCVLELFYNECYITAHFGKMSIKSEDFIVDGDCWRCGNDYNFHKRGGQLTGDFYECEHCGLKFFTCIMYIDHLGSCIEYRKFLKRNTFPLESKTLVFYTCFICKLVLTTKEILVKHYKHCHAVRSDLPTIQTVKNCASCGGNYADYLLHSCPKKNYSIACTLCGMRFPSKVACDLHKKINKQSFKCTFCHYILHSRCVEIKHLILNHSTNFKLLYKCIICKESIFLLDELSMRQHSVIWHKKKCMRSRIFAEMVVVPANCISGMVEQMDIVTSLSGKFEIVAKPNSNGVLEVSQVEEINFNDNNEQKSNDKGSAKVVVVEDEE